MAIDITHLKFHLHYYCFLHHFLKSGQSIKQQTKPGLYSSIFNVINAPTCQLQATTECAVGKRHTAAHHYTVFHQIETMDIKPQKT